MQDVYKEYQPVCSCRIEIIMFTVYLSSVPYYVPAGVFPPASLYSRGVVKCSLSCILDFTRLICLDSRIVFTFLVQSESFLKDVTSQEVWKAGRLEGWKVPSHAAVLGWLRSLGESKETHTQLLLFIVIAVIITPSLVTLNYCCCFLPHDANAAATLLLLFLSLAVAVVLSWISNVLRIYTKES